MYIVIRIIIMLILILMVFIINKKTIKQWGNKKKSLFLVIAFMIFYALLSLPFENSIMSFKTPVEAFKYKFFGENIIKVVEDKNNTFIIYGNDVSSVSFTAMEKINNGWKFTNSFTPNKIKFKIYEKYTIITIQIVNSNKKMIIVTDDNLKEPISNIKINDNQNSEFSSFYGKYRNAEYYSVFYYTIIDSKIEDYQLIINDKVIENVNNL